MKSIYHDAKVTVEAITSLSDNVTVTGVGVDMAEDGGYEAVAFVAAAQHFENVGTYTFYAQHDITSAFSTVTDVAGSSTTFASTTWSATPVVPVVLCIDKPQKRHVRAILNCPNGTTTTQAVSIVALRYNPRKAPVTAPAGKFLKEPATGTA